MKVLFILPFLCRQQTTSKSQAFQIDPPHIKHLIIRLHKYYDDIVDTKRSLRIINDDASSQDTGAASVENLS